MPTISHATQNTAPTPDRDLFTPLAFDVRDLVVGFLSAPDTYALMRVNKDFHRNLSDYELWRRHHGVPYPRPPLAVAPGGYAQWCRDARNLKPELRIVAEESGAKLNIYAKIKSTEAENAALAMNSGPVKDFLQRALAAVEKEDDSSADDISLTSQDADDPPIVWQPWADGATLMEEARKSSLQSNEDDVLRSAQAQFSQKCVDQALKFADAGHGGAAIGFLETAHRTVQAAKLGSIEMFAIEVASRLSLAAVGQVPEGDYSVEDGEDIGICYEKAKTKLDNAERIAATWGIALTSAFYKRLADEILMASYSGWCLEPDPENLELSDFHRFAFAYDCIKRSGADFPQEVKIGVSRGARCFIEMLFWDFRTRRTNSRCWSGDEIKEWFDLLSRCLLLVGEPIRKGEYIDLLDNSLKRACRLLTFKKHTLTDEEDLVVGAELSRAVRPALGDNLEKDPIHSQQFGAERTWESSRFQSVDWLSLKDHVENAKFFAGCAGGLGCEVNVPAFMCHLSSLAIKGLWDGGNGFHLAHDQPLCYDVIAGWVPYVNKAQASEDLNKIFRVGLNGAAQKMRAKKLVEARALVRSVRNCLKLGGQALAERFYQEIMAAHPEFRPLDQAEGPAL